MKNQQLAEKPVLNETGESLQVNSIFYTIQGEGPFAGCPAVFIRLAGCNLQCPGCDTEYKNRNLLNINQILQVVLKNVDDKYVKFKPIIVITGGEPFRQNLAPLIELLLMKKWIVQIETNGTLYQELPFHNEDLTIVCSPKTGAINKELYPHISAFKYVIAYDDFDESDGLPNHALGHPCKKLARPEALNRKPIYIQPMDAGENRTKSEWNLQQAISSSMEHGHILCVQVHKIVGLD